MLVLFTGLLLLLDFTGGIDLINLRYPISVVMFVILVASSYPFIYWGIIFGGKKGEEKMWAIAGGGIGLAVFIALFVLLVIFLVNISV
jgi:hypothetical protein